MYYHWTSLVRLYVLTVTGLVPSNVLTLAGLDWLDVLSQIGLIPLNALNLTDLVRLDVVPTPGWPVPTKCTNSDWSGPTSCTNPNWAGLSVWFLLVLVIHPGFSSIFHAHYHKYIAIHWKYTLFNKRRSGTVNLAQTLRCMLDKTLIFLQLKFCMNGICIALILHSAAREELPCRRKRKRSNKK
jgi:hypothetical protein